MVTRSCVLSDVSTAFKSGQVLWEKEKNTGDIIINSTATELMLFIRKEVANVQGTGHYW